MLEEFLVPVLDPAAHPVCSKGTHPHGDKEWQMPHPAQYSPTKNSKFSGIIKLPGKGVHISLPSIPGHRYRFHPEHCKPLHWDTGRSGYSPVPTCHWGNLWSNPHHANLPKKKKKGIKVRNYSGFPPLLSEDVSCLWDVQYWGKIHCRIYQLLQLRACPGWNKGVQGHLVTSVHSTHLQMGANRQKRLMEDLKWK